MDDPSSYIVIFVSLLFSAFFSGSEIAFVAANKLKIEVDSNAGKLSGRILSRFIRQSDRFIATMLIGNNIALVVYGMNFAEIINPFLQQLLSNDALVLLFQTIFATILILVTAEFLPKVFFQINPNAILNYLALPLFFVNLILYVPTMLSLMLSRGILTFLGVKSGRTEKVFTKTDLMHFVRDVNARIKDNSEIDHEIKFLQNALDFTKIRARDCMVPRTDIIALDIETDIQTLRDKFIESGLSKIIIYRDDIDHVIGYVHSFDLFKKPNSIKQILLPIPIIPEAMPGKQVMELFARQSGNIAIVVDEFGGTSGLITIEDLIEEIFGDIEDEHDKEVWIEQQIDQNTFLFSARHEVEYLNEHYQLNLPESEDYDTLGGLILNYLERIPEKDDILELETINLRIKIVEVSDRRIDLVEISRV
jgi:CBS domain containing-hemolysin-like protein